MEKNCEPINLKKLLIPFLVSVAHSLYEAYDAMWKSKLWGTNRWLIRSIANEKMGERSSYYTRGLLPVKRMNMEKLVTFLFIL